MKDSNTYIRINELNIHYNVSGSGDNVVIIHGLSSSINLLDGLVKNISTYKKVYTLDLPGFGLSDEMKKPWTIDDYVECIIKFIEMNDIKKCSIIAHSIGGSIIIKMLGEYDTSFDVDKIILINSNGIVHDNEKTIARKKKRKKFLYKLFFNKKIVKRFPKYRRMMVYLFGNYDYDRLSKTMKDTVDNLLKENIEKYLPNIFQESLLIWGNKDKETPISDAYRMRHLLPNCRLVEIKGGEHFVFLQEPLLVKQNIEKFLK